MAEEITKKAQSLITPKVTKSQSKGKMLETIKEHHEEKTQSGHKNKAVFRSLVFSKQASDQEMIMAKQ